MLVRKKNYDLWQLVDRRNYKDLGNSDKKIRIVSDIDKTYLETAFESWVKMARIAFEDASDKKAVRGAPQLLSSLRWGDPDKAMTQKERSSYPRPLHFVSSSPPQLRNVLEEKLSMDGLDWSSDTFKNQAYNIRKRQFHLLKQQVAYKSAALIQLISGEDPDATWYLIGDNAESDPFIYLGIKLLCEGKLSREAYGKWLSLASVESEMSQSLWSQDQDIPKGKIGGIFIRNIPNHRFFGESPLTDPITLFDSYLDASLVFYQCGLLTASALEKIILLFHNLYDISPEEICSKLTSTIKHCGAKAQVAPLNEILASFAKAANISLPARYTHAIKMAGLDFWNQLSEQDILQHGENWMNKIHLNKKH